MLTVNAFTLNGDVHRVLYRVLVNLRNCMVRCYGHYLVSIHVCKTLILNVSLFDIFCKVPTFFHP